MTDPRPVFRFAPSPTGELHLGHAYSALFTQDMARRFAGRLLLRIEDTDQTRCRIAYEQGFYEDLAWLGIEWEQPVRRQSEHLADYAAVLERLKALGLAYPCFASRKEIAEAAAMGSEIPRDPDGSPLYPGLYRNADPKMAEARIAAGEPHALRLDMEKALARALDIAGGTLTFDSFDETGHVRRVIAHPERWGDVLLASRDRPASYHLAVVTDDAAQDVTHVTRGADLLAATDVHRLLQTLLGFPAPFYCHHRLVLDASGRKLAKSDGDKSLGTLRADGMSAAALRRQLGFDSA
jgi:glutamyl-Q tRNA(Asp) synthetase